jgi:hypothetical protein
MRRFCGRLTSEIRRLRNDGLQDRRRDRLILFHAGNGRSNQPSAFGGVRVGQPGPSLVESGDNS